MEFLEKIARFTRPRGKSFRPVLVYDGALAPSVEGSGYFDAIVPFNRLLGV